VRAKRGIIEVPKRPPETSVPICPVDLLSCARAACRGGRCERAQEAVLVHCWECGTLAAGAMRIGICVECVRAYVAETTERRT
jgi:hypothetical protein